VPLLPRSGDPDTTVASKALFDSRQQYHAAVEDQTALICRFRPDGVVTFANRAFTDSLGRLSVNPLNLDFWSRLPADQRAIRRSELTRLTPDQPLATWEHEAQVDGESARWEQWRVRALFDESGAVYDYHASGRDITDRKLAEEERRLRLAQQEIVHHVTQARALETRERELLQRTLEANAKFRGFFEQGAILAAIVDVNGTLLDANRAACEECGYTKEQVTGIPIWEVPWLGSAAAELAPVIKAACAEAVAGRAFRTEMPYYVADGADGLPTSHCNRSGTMRAACCSSAPRVRMSPPQASGGRSRAVRGADREQRGLHRHGRSRGRRSSSTTPVSHWSGWIASRTPAYATSRLFLSGRSRPH
jgi:PAS domain S-box-containing protein